MPARGATKKKKRRSVDHEKWMATRKAKAMSDTHMEVQNLELEQVEALEQMNNGDDDDDDDGMIAMDVDKRPKVKMVIQKRTTAVKKAKKVDEFVSVAV